MPRYVNSLDKVVFSYFAAVAKKPFEYRGKTIVAKPLQVSPLIFRGFCCPEKCGGCCPRFSLEYIPSELYPPTAFQYEVAVNGNTRPLFHDPQTDHADHHCRFLDKKSGRCLIYQRRPFHCDFELIRVFISHKQNRLSQQLFGRKWQLLRVDNCRGALCQMTPVDDTTVAEVMRKLKRLKEWTDHFGVETWLPEILTWVAQGPHAKPLVLVTPEQVVAQIEVAKP